jgi:hypothetical protein
VLVSVIFPEALSLPAEPLLRALDEKLGLSMPGDSVMLAAQRVYIYVYGASSLHVTEMSYSQGKVVFTIVEKDLILFSFGEQNRRLGWRGQQSRYKVVWLGEPTHVCLAMGCGLSGTLIQALLQGVAMVNTQTRVDAGDGCLRAYKGAD